MRPRSWAVWRAAMLWLGLGLMAGVSLGRAGAPDFHTSPRASVLVCGGSMMNGNEFAGGVIPVMQEHYHGCRNIALVLHASLPADRDAMEARLQKAFAALLGGKAKVESLHRRDAAGARTLLQEADGIFVGGGETFVLLAELQRTGQLEIIRARVLAGVPFGGSSAGANVAGLRIGTTNDFPTADVKSIEALGVFPAVINPHHPLPDTPDHGGRAWKIGMYLKFNPNEIVCGMTNASVVRWHGGRAKLAAGRVWVYRASGVKELAVGEDATELLR